MAQRQQKGVKVFVTEKGVLLAHEKDDVLGRGTYGVVYRAHLESDPSIKKAVKIFSPETMDEAEGIPSTTLREINALKAIVHPNVMTAEEVVIPDGRSPADMFFVMELCKGTLKDKVIDLIRKHLHSDPVWLNPPPDLRLPDAYVKEVKVIAWQLLNSLAVVHSRGVMHRDLKPVNILWGYDDLLKLADFGLARFVRGNQNAENSVLQQTGEVQTMWYRAPEVLLGDEKYGLLVDDWSLGCVIAELFRFRRNSSGRMEPAPLFQGRSDIGTLMIIFETLGTPQPKVNKSQEYLGRLRYWNDGYPNWVQGTLRSRIPLLDDLGFDLLKDLLCLSPSERKAARFLLNHPWFDDVRPQLANVVPWYRGFEEDYKRMMAVDRLPLPRTIREVGSSSTTATQAAQDATRGRMDTQHIGQSKDASSTGLYTRGRSTSPMGAPPSTQDPSSRQPRREAFESRQDVQQSGPPPAANHAFPSKDTILAPSSQMSDDGARPPQQVTTTTSSQYSVHSFRRERACVPGSKIEAATSDATHSQSLVPRHPTGASSSTIVSDTFGATKSFSSFLQLPTDSVNFGVLGPAEAGTSAVQPKKTVPVTRARAALKAGTGSMWSLTSRSRSPDRARPPGRPRRQAKAVSPRQQQLAVVSRSSTTAGTETSEGASSQSDEPDAAAATRKPRGNLLAPDLKRLGPRTRSATAAAAAAATKGRVLPGVALRASDRH